MEISGVDFPLPREVKRLIPLILLVLFGASAPGGASLAIFNDGRVVKIADYRVSGQDIEITLPGGGDTRLRS